MYKNDKMLGCVVVCVVMAALLLILYSAGLFGYVWHGVGPTEVAVQTYQGRITGIVGPGLYTVLGPWNSIQNISVAAIPFVAHDPEVLTGDSSPQRIGVRVSGVVLRPGVEIGLEQYTLAWSNYRSYLQDDRALVGQLNSDNTLAREGLMQQIGQQAMKSCVGDQPFKASAVGAKRDALGICIDERMSEIAKGYYLEIRNVIVPNVELNTEVQASMDAIVKSQYDTAQAQQNQLKAVAEADRALAEQQGVIRVEQGKLQETQRQKAITALLEQKAIEAQLAVIEAQKTNELKQAQLDLQITSVQVDVSKQKAAADIAVDVAKAAMYTANPTYADLLKTQYASAAYKETDKIIVPAGSNPAIVIGGSTVPTIGVGN